MRYTPLATDAHGGLCPRRPMPYARESTSCYWERLYDLLQLQFKTHSVLKRLGFRAGPLDSFGNCVKRRLVPHPHRIGLPPRDCPYQTLYIPATGSARRNCGGLRGTELISHQAQPVSNREILWAPQQINPPWDLLRLGPGTELWRRVQDRTSSSKHQFTPDRCLFRPCQSFHQLSWWLLSV